MKNLYIAIGLLISGSAFGQIEQNVNKTTGTESNPITEIDSIRFNAGQTEMEIIFNNGSMESHTIADIDNVTFSEEIAGVITSLDCAGATINGTLFDGVAASGVSVEIGYTGGNGGPHNGQTVTSTGVTGLTATLAAGNFANGAGTLTYEISGTPDADGTASFAIEIGGVTCTLEISVDENLYPPGTVHCGAPTEIIDVTNPVTGKIWMDRNLGASQVATSSTDVDAYGDLYQWGRGADGHQCRSSSTTFDLSSADQPGHDDFIQSPSQPGDWRNPQNDNLWQGINGINNPCPIGYRLPTFTELNNERLSWVQSPISSTNNATGAFDSPLKLSMTGGRNRISAVIENDGTFGYYWTSSVSGVSGESASALFFNNSSNAVFNAIARATGYAVRCIKD